MTAFVLDNSVVMRWCFDVGTNAYAERILDLLAAEENRAFVPALWRYEVSAVLARAQRVGVLTEEKAAAFFLSLPPNIIVDMDGIERFMMDVHRIAVTYRLTAYDAAYLELALRKDLPLSTLDDELRTACKKAGVTVL